VLPEHYNSKKQTEIPSIWEAAALQFMEVRIQISKSICLEGGKETIISRLIQIVNSDKHMLKHFDIDIDIRSLKSGSLD